MLLGDTIPVLKYAVMAALEGTRSVFSRLSDNKLLNAGMRDVKAVKLLRFGMDRSTASTVFVFSVLFTAGMLEAVADADIIEPLADEAMPLMLAMLLTLLCAAAAMMRLRMLSLMMYFLTFRAGIEQVSCGGGVVGGA